MRREGEGPIEEKQFEGKHIESRSEFSDYIKRLAGDANYSVSVRQKALEIYKELSRYSTLPLERSADVGSHARLSGKHFDALGGMFADLRQLLMISGKGDSECAQIIEQVHEKIK